MINLLQSNRPMIGYGIPRGLIVRPMLFNVFISDPGDRMEHALTRSADDTKHGEIIGMMEYKATIHGNLNKLQECPSGNLMKFNRCKNVKSCTWNINKYRLGTDWLESSFVKKDLGVLMGNKLNVIHELL